MVVETLGADRGALLIVEGNATFVRHARHPEGPLEPSAWEEISRSVIARARASASNGPTGASAEPRLSIPAMVSKVMYEQQFFTKKDRKQIWDEYPHATQLWTNLKTPSTSTCRIAGAAHPTRTTDL
mgnify:CR=1 FL=1